MRLGTPAFQSYHRTLSRVYMLDLIDQQQRRLEPRKPASLSAPSCEIAEADGQRAPTRATHRRGLSAA